MGGMGLTTMEWEAKQQEWVKMKARKQLKDLHQVMEWKIMAVDLQQEWSVLETKKLQWKARRQPKEWKVMVERKPRKEWKAIMAVDLQQEWSVLETKKLQWK